MSTLIFDLMDEDSPEVQKAIRIGKSPIADTDPRVYLCGHCRTREVREGDGICRHCRAMLGGLAAVPGAWIPWAWALVTAAMLSIVLIVIFANVK